MMEVNEYLPDWLVLCFRVTLLGEIYPEVRAVAVGYSDFWNLLIRYYLDRNPTEFDDESIDVFATNLDSTAPPDSIKKIDVECVFSEELLRDLDKLTGFVYRRREY